MPHIYFSLKIFRVKVKKRNLFQMWHRISFISFVNLLLLKIWSAGAGQVQMDNVLNSSNFNRVRLLIPRRHHCQAHNHCPIQFCPVSFLNWANPSLYFLYFNRYNTAFNTVDSKTFCRWRNSNRRSFVSEATALPSVPQPLPCRYLVFKSGNSRAPFFFIFV